MRVQRSVIPNFYLYGEAPRPVSERFLHLEALYERCRPSHGNIRAHAHADLSHVFLIESGGGRLLAEFQAQAFTAPCLLLVPAGEVHGFVFDPDAGGLVLTLARAYQRELIGREPSFATLFATAQCLALHDAAPVHESLLGLAQELSWQAPGQAAAIESHLLSVLVVAVRLSRPRQGLPRRQACGDALVDRFRELLERPDGPLRRDVAAYASCVGVSVPRLRRACQRAAGCSPLQLIQRQLLREAKRALLYSTLSVAQIAYRLGFDDPAYFSRFFRKRERLSPSQFRRGANQQPAWRP